MKHNQFREDLFYRLSVVPINIPPLRDRREDIPSLIFKFLEDYNKRHHVHKGLSSTVLNRLQQFSYPGNVRQLLNILEQLALMSDGDTIELEDLPEELKSVHLTTRDGSENSLNLKEALECLEKQMIQDALEHYPTEVSAARALGIHATTLWRKTSKYGIK